MESKIRNKAVLVIAFLILLLYWLKYQMRNYNSKGIAIATPKEVIMTQIRMRAIEETPQMTKFRAQYGDDVDSSVPFGLVLQELQAGNEQLINEISAAIVRTSFAAVFWECIPVTQSTLSTTNFEFVVMDSPALAVIQEADIGPFSEYFAQAERSAAADPKSSPKLAISFPNLGGDSTLVVPCPLPTAAGPLTTAHIAPFLRKAPTDRVIALWKTVGESMLEVLHRLAPAEKRWLSTCGTGVSWLHVRIDSVPKYYTYTPYREM